MSEIILPPSTEEQEDQTDKIVCNYVPTPNDEEKFFLMYHLNMQPSEVDKLDVEYRRWIIIRFIQQRKMEHEQIMQQRMMQQIGPNLRAE